MMGPLARKKASKAYLGDGCSVSFDGFALWLTAEHGIHATDTICLEPEVYKALTDYVARLSEPKATAP